MGLAELPNGHEAETFDVLIVGAGVSGINAAYRLQTQLPNATFTLLEGRAGLGGTWDLFRYPGIRSDSDLFTYGFQWEPWPYETPIAKGPLIKEYMENCIEKYRLGRHMRFRHRVVAADWSRETERWTVTAEESSGSHEGRTREFRATWVVLGTGYYDYDEPFKTDIPGLNDFAGRVIHPQHWPDDFDHAGKRMVVVGSGATAITLVPALAETAAAVTMVQRSPTYIVAATNGSPATSGLMKILPKAWAGTWLRVSYLWKIYGFVLLSRYFPETARALLKRRTQPLLPSRIPFSPHFSPSYTPWQQRLCLSPDGDFFAALRAKPSTTVVTGRIAAVTARGVRMEKKKKGAEDGEGEEIEADAIVTATGLQMRIGGKIAVTVNGEPVDWAGRLVWNGAMVQDVPNLMLMVGYVDAAWTLGADATAHILTRLIKYTASKGVTTAVPRAPPGGAGSYRRFWPLTSTYSERAEATLPKYGDAGPWQPRVSPPLDWMHGKWGDVVTGLHFCP